MADKTKRCALRNLCSFVIIFAILLTGAAAAYAKGTVRVQQSSGSMQVYRDVTIRIAQKALRVTTADGKGTLIIDKAACSFTGEIQTCLPYSIKLDQGGSVQPLDFERGTVYVNLTSAKQQLPYSSTQLPPQGILLSLRTKIGTIVNLTGEIDQVTK
jgi:hypothetical protein